MIELICAISMWICAIVCILLMHRVAPEQKAYKIWAILDAITVSVLMIYYANH